MKNNITIVIYQGVVEAVYCTDPSAVTVTVLDRDIATAAIEHLETPEPYEAMPPLQLHEMRQRCYRHHAGVS